jgi:hypothetical protein
MRVNRTVVAATTLAAGISLLAGCGGSASGASAARSGIETFSGRLTGSAALASNPVFHLTFRGPVTTTAAFPLGAPSENGHTHTFKTAAGNFVVVTGKGSSTEKLLSTSTCRFAFTSTVPYTVVGDKSTGQFAGAAGTGKAVLLFQGDLPKLSNGQCDTTPSAQPAVSTVVSTFSAAGPLTLR